MNPLGAMRPGMPPPGSAHPAIAEPRGTLIMKNMRLTFPLDRSQCRLPAFVPGCRPLASLLAVRCHPHPRPCLIKRLYSEACT